MVLILDENSRVIGNGAREHGAREHGVLYRCCDSVILREWWSTSREIKTFIVQGCWLLRKTADKLLATSQRIWGRENRYCSMKYLAQQVGLCTTTAEATAAIL